MGRLDDSSSSLSIASTMVARNAFHITPSASTCGPIKSRHLALAPRCCPSTCSPRRVALWRPLAPSQVTRASYCRPSRLHWHQLKSNFKILTKSFSKYNFGYYSKNVSNRLCIWPFKSSGSIPSLPLSIFCFTHHLVYLFIVYWISLLLFCEIYFRE